MKPSPLVILASTSPRRIELLSQIGLPFEVRSPRADETPIRGEKPGRLVSRLALEKAESVMAELAGQVLDAVIIAADTIVVAPDGRKILGKPRDAKDAARMLRSLAGRTHEVFTGYCILRVGMEGAESFVRVVRSKVTLRPLSARDIANYVETEEPMDKAGSYAAQGKGMALIDRISGSYTNVVGLPIAQVVADLENRFGYPLFKWHR
ncbi:MAG: Maf family protein [Oligoflexia bacterium]|nr:Maf family protein [Oligoflexia bacterium]